VVKWELVLEKGGQSPSVGCVLAASDAEEHDLRFSKPTAVIRCLEVVARPPLVSTETILTVQPGLGKEDFHE
jgi:hypothetical protein